MQDTRVRNVIAGLVVGLTLLSAGMMYGRHNTQPSIVITGALPASPTQPTAPAKDTVDPAISASAASSTPPPTLAASTKPASDLIYVHVAGAVKHPNLYELPVGTRVAGAIKAAGGPAADADIDAVNLAEKVTDGEKVYVPRKGETDAPAAPAGNSVGYASSSPDVAAAPVADAGHSTGSSSSHGHSSNKLTSPSQGKVNLNTATAEELERLPGVGPSTAANIIAYRKQNGGFKKPTDLMDISGIGEKKMAKLAPFVVVR